MSQLWGDLLAMLALPCQLSHCVLACVSLCMYSKGRAFSRFMPCACCMLTQLVCFRWLD